MNNDTTFDPSPLVPELGEYILIPFVGFTLFGILASLGAYIRRQRTHLLGLRPRHREAYSSSEQNYDSDEYRDEQEELTEPLWKHEEEFSGFHSFS